jgi:hypothetical protein
LVALKTFRDGSSSKFRWNRYIITAAHAFLRDSHEACASCPRFVAGIHVLLSFRGDKDVDGRDKARP